MLILSYNVFNQVGSKGVQWIALTLFNYFILPDRQSSVDTEAGDIVA